MAANLTAYGPSGGVAFSVRKTSVLSNVALGAWTVYPLDQERFDIGSNFASNVFTAPVTGKYQLNCNLRWEQIDSAHTGLYGRITTSNLSYHSWMNPSQIITSDGEISLFLAVTADMDANDTAGVDVYTIGGTAQADIEPSQSYFTGHLVA